MLLTFKKHIDLKINVLSDEILFLGSPEEAAGKLLQGTVDVTLTEPTKIKSISLSFVGNMRVNWTEDDGRHLQYQQRNIINHVWTFFSKQKATILSAGKHSWPFELVLPGNLPQTFLSNTGGIAYNLTATIDKPSLIQNCIIKKKPIHIMRCIFKIDQPWLINNTWPEKVMYDISIPSRTYIFNETIPVSIHLKPLAHNLQVQDLVVSLKEYTTYNANGHTKTESRMVATTRIDHPFNKHDPSWDSIVHLHVPERSPYVIADTDCELISVHHRLKFTATLINEDGHASELRCACQVVILESIAMADEFNTLPAYDEMWRSCPYEEECPSASHSIHSSIDEDDISIEVPLYNFGMDLGKVPSYRTLDDCIRI